MSYSSTPSSSAATPTAISLSCPLEGTGTPWGAEQVMSCDTLRKIALEKEKAMSFAHSNFHHSYADLTKDLARSHSPGLVLVTLIAPRMDSTNPWPSCGTARSYRLVQTPDFHTTRTVDKTHTSSSSCYKENSGHCQLYPATKSDSGLEGGHCLCEMGSGRAAIPVVTLEPSGLRMPLLGMGTAAYPPVPPEAVKAAVLHAIRLGYRHFDTAAVYGTEQALGEAIADAVSQGLVESRDELFVTTKLWCSDAHRDHVVPALKNSLRNLGLDYVDLYLVHMPVSTKPGHCVLILKEADHMNFDMASVWEAMEQCHSLGLAKAIGVSNFSCKKLEALLQTAKIAPQVNQVEMNPMWRQHKLRECCAAWNIIVSAYSPLGGIGTPWGAEQVMSCDVLREIALAKGKTVAQICLRWVYEQNVSVLVKSYNVKRMEENLDILDWELNEEERLKISQIPESRSCPKPPSYEFCSSNVQYKSMAELWDNEI